MTALASGTPIEVTAVRRQSIRFVTDPASVPSSRTARFPVTVTACPPRSYVPSAMPVARMLSLINTILSSPKILKAVRTTEGCTCTPSQINSTMQSPSSAAAPIGPGARWLRGGMALNIWVSWEAPSESACLEIS